jgi:pimeloyl-ACP methyl ester carboxylesterase
MTAPPVVLLHGWSGSTATTWDPLGWPERLRAMGRQVIAIDLLGHGTAAAPTDTAAYAALVEEAGAHIADREPVDAIAFSLGAKVLLELVARRPERFRRIVLAGIGENAFRDEKVPAVLAAALREGISATTPPAVLPYVVTALASGNDRQALAACIERPWTPIDPERLAPFGGRVLVAIGELDTFVGEHEPLVRAFRDAQYLPLPGVDHLGTPYSARLLPRALEFLDD